MAECVFDAPLDASSPLELSLEGLGIALRDLRSTAQELMEMGRSDLGGSEGPVDPLSGQGVVVPCGVAHEDYPSPCGPPNRTIERAARQWLTQEGRRRFPTQLHVE